MTPAGARLRSGTFVRCYFPYGRAPDEPAPDIHLVYVLAVNEAASGSHAVVAYTTSKIVFPNPPVPSGVRIFGRDEAARLNQKPFMFDGRSLGYLPLSQKFFPDLDDAERLVRGSAPKALRDELLGLVLDALRRNVVVTVGPSRPGTAGRGD